MAPITNPAIRTLQADGATWEAYLQQLKAQRQTAFLDSIIHEFPPQFQRDEIVRITLKTRSASKILQDAGVSS